MMGFQASARPTEEESLEAVSASKGPNPQVTFLPSR